MHHTSPAPHGGSGLEHDGGGSGRGAGHRERDTHETHPDGGLLWVWNKKGQEANRERSCLLIGGAPGMHIDVTALIH